MITPPRIPFTPPSKATYTKGFDSLGVRVPGLVVSPLVSPKGLCHDVLDHTSILQFLAEKFTPGRSYSDAVALRAGSGITSVSAALDRAAPRRDVPVAPDFSIEVRFPLGLNRPPVTPLEETFEEAAFYMMKRAPKATSQKYSEVSHWVLTQQDRPHA